MAAPPLTVRPGTEADLEACASVFLASIGVLSVPPTPVYELHRHVLGTGDLVVAEHEGRVVGFGGSLVRGGRWFLSDLFVDPGSQASGAGGAILSRLLTSAGPSMARMTMASSDPRAQALYARAGMAPRWPAFYLSALASATPLGRERPAGWTVEPIDDDAVPARLAPAGHLLDPVDLGYWRRTLDTELLAVTGPSPFAAAPPAMATVVVRRNNPFVSADPAAVSFGPLTIASPGPAMPAEPPEARAALDAVVWWLRDRGLVSAQRLRFLVPGPHPALVPLLEAGFTIDDVDLYCASAPELLSPRLSCPSHDLL